MAKFFERFNFPGIVGCIDCTHIAIVPPPANDLVYPGLAFINRKNYHSINCQIVCDADLKIRHINARYPGSVHDAAIWIVSNLRECLLENFHNARDRLTWLLGDSGYPLQPFLLTPIVGADPNTPDGRYTESHVRTRNVVERCIGVLKAYFRCLRKDRVLHYKPDIAAKIIYACAMLHNILRERNIIDDDLEIGVILIENICLVFLPRNTELNILSYFLRNAFLGIEDGQDGEDGQNGDDGQNGENLQEVDLLREAREIRNNLILQVFA
ncbi:hypothetical protein JTB14_013825 [Gonioctena quinquepunctata]|nr:hypothetical protein JTB14_013825 [Gonioctena quinquepunctata]